MSVRQRKDTGKWESRYYYKGKRYHVGSKFESEKVANIAERVHRLGIKKLEGLNVETYQVPYLAKERHTDWQGSESRMVLANLLSPLATKFSIWMNRRRRDRALSKETERQLKTLEPKAIAVVFEKD